MGKKCTESDELEVLFVQMKSAQMKLQILPRADDIKIRFSCDVGIGCQSDEADFFCVEK